MKTIKNIGTWILGILATIIGFLLISKPTSKTDLEERKDEIQDKLEEIEKEEKALEENGVEDLDEKEVVEYWEKNNE